MEIRKGDNYAHCPMCGHDVRVVASIWSDPDVGVKKGDPMFVRHTTNGERTTSHTHTPCRASDGPAKNVLRVA